MSEELTNVLVTARRRRYDVPVRVSARTDYAIRAATVLAASDAGLVKGEQISRAEGIPLKFLLNILNDLRHARIVRSHRGSDGGYALARPAREITVADVVRAVDGPLAAGHHSDEPPPIDSPPARLRAVWVAVHASIEAVLEGVTLADLVSGSPRGVPLMSADGS